MTDFQTLIVEQTEGVLEVTLNRPESFNALTRPIAKEMMAVLKMASRDDSIRCILLTGAGRGFCAGQDLVEVTSRGPDFSLRWHLNTSYNPMVLAMRQLEKPIVAAINGACAGAGFGLALAADIRFASDKAKFVAAFIGIGLVPDTGVSYWLPRLIGPARATEFLFTNEKVDSARAAELGIVSRVIAHDALMAESRAFAAQLAVAPTLGLGLTKRMINKSLGIPVADQLDYEAYHQEIASRSADYKEGVNAFLEKRAPSFEGK